MYACTYLNDLSKITGIKHHFLYKCCIESNKLFIDTRILNDVLHIIFSQAIKASFLFFCQNMTLHIVFHQLYCNTPQYLPSIADNLFFLLLHWIQIFHIFLSNLNCIFCTVVQLLRGCYPYNHF